MWTTLYILCGVSSWLVWTHGGFEKQRVPLTLYGINMLFNLAWNPTFFLFHAMQTAFWDALGMSPVRLLLARKALVRLPRALRSILSDCVLHRTLTPGLNARQGRRLSLCILGLCRLLPG